MKEFSPNTTIKSNEVNENFAETAGIAGEVKMFAGSSAPTGWLLCQGQAISRTTYAVLYNVIGTAFGSGDGSNTFNLPDFQDRCPKGKSGTKALGSTGGAETANLYHTHTMAHVHGGIDHLHGSGSLSFRLIHNHGFGGNMGGSRRDNNSSDFAHYATGYSAPSHHHEGSTATNEGGQEWTHQGSGLTGGSDRSLTTGGASNETTSASLSASQSILDPYQAINFIIKV